MNRSPNKKTSLPRNVKSEATDAIRGYTSQFALTADSILNGNSSDKTYVEVFEDFLKVTSNGKVTAIQVKDRAGTISVTTKDTCEMLNRWIEEADKISNFEFWSTQTPGKLTVKKDDCFIRWVANHDDINALETIFNLLYSLVSESYKADFPALWKLLESLEAFEAFWRKISWQLGKHDFEQQFNTLSETIQKSGISDKTSRACAFIGAIACSATSKNAEEKCWTRERLIAVTGTEEKYEKSVAAVTKLVEQKFDILTSKVAVIDEKVTTLLEKADQNSTSLSEELAQRYRNWVEESSSCFYVPGLNITMPIENAWVRLGLMKNDNAIIGKKSSLDEEFKNYAEFGQRVRGTSRSDSVSSDSLLLTHNKTVIVGGPGDGKSTMLKRFAWAFSKRGYIVVHLRLPVIVRHILAKKSFEEAIRSVAFDGFGVVDADAGNLLNSADVLLCDGLDECDPHRDKVSKLINQWSAGHPNCAVTVSTRPVGHETIFLPGFEHFAIQPPEDHDINDLSTKLFKKFGEETGQSWHQQWLLFSKELNSDSETTHVKKLAARNPLLLGFLIRLSMDGVAFNGTRCGLYSEIIKVFASSTPNEKEKVVVNERVAFEFIKALAWNQMSDPFCAAKKSLEFASSHLANKFNLSELDGDEEAGKASKFWLSHGLIEVVSAGIEARLFFIHLSMQEFAAASYVKNLSADEFSKWITSVRRSSHWQQVILLAAGLDEDSRTINELLKLGEPSDPVSTELLLASDALFENENRSTSATSTLVQSLSKRFRSNIPLVSVEACTKLAQLGRLEPDQLGDLANDDALDSPWHLLGRFLIRLIVNDPKQMAEEFKTWFANHELIQTAFPVFRLRNEHETIPSEGREIQDQILDIGMNALFENSSKEEIKQYFDATSERPQLSAGALGKIQRKLNSIGLEEVSNSLWSFAPSKAQIESITAGSERWKRSRLRLLEIAVAAFDQPNNTIAEPPYLNLSVLLSTMGIWELALRDLVTLEDVIPDEDSVGHEVIRALSRALGLSEKTMAIEASAALHHCKQTDKALSNYIEKTSGEPDWTKVGDCDHELIASGLTHPCPLFNLPAADALIAGVGKDFVLTTLQEALESSSQYTLGYSAEVATECLGDFAAVNLFLKRLENPIYDGHAYLFRAMAQNCTLDQRDAVVDCFFKWLTVDDPETASLIAVHLAEFSPPLPQEVVPRLRDVLDHWTQRGTVCSKHGKLSSRHCPECSRVPPCPRHSFVKELCRLRQFTLTDLVQLHAEKDHDVSRIAKEQLLEMSSNDDVYFENVIDLIVAGDLSPRLMDEFLKLPIEKNSAIARKVEALLSSVDLPLRLSVIGQLTGDWIEPTVAKKQLEFAISDDEPRVRTLATRILRLVDV